MSRSGFPRSSSSILSTAFISPKPSKPIFCAKRTTEALETAQSRARSWMEARHAVSLWLSMKRQMLLSASLSSFK